MFTGLDSILAKLDGFSRYNMLCFNQTRQLSLKTGLSFTLIGQIYNAQHILEDHKRHCSNSDLLPCLQP
ncbi:hypothetical protein D9M69_536880 [compost metagenome]